MTDINRTEGYFLPELETMPREKRREYHNQRLSEIVDYAYQHAPAIRQKFNDAGAEPGDVRTVEDLEKLPITEKSDLVKKQKEDLPFGGFAGIPVERMRRIFVSPGPIYEPGEADWEDDRWTQAFYAAGFRPGDLTVITFSYHLVPFGMALDESFNLMGVKVIPTGVGNTEVQVNTLKDLKVTGFAGTPSFLNVIADRAEELGLNLKKDLHLKVGFSAAEMLPESLRSSLEDRFGMIIRQSYGTADVGCLGYECRCKNGMHYPDKVIVEIVDPVTGKHLGPGEIGEVVCTVFNHVYPLIRFGSGDLAYYTDEPCVCGRTTPRIVKIVGRVDQVTKVKGMFIHPGQAAEVAKNFPEISRYQIVVTRQEHKDIMTFVAELTEESGDTVGLAEKIAEFMPSILRIRGEVRFVPQGTIPAGAKTIDDQRVWD
ncbi:MAG: AMP-binding protein [Deltaproteobacteria bacterium]|nr:AMP-binding protein [Deltaproteobacteria bacterium]